MIDVSDIVADGELQAPKPLLINRSTSQFVLGGIQSITAILAVTGIVQRAGDKELDMLPEADRNQAVMAFWLTIPIYTTRGKDASPGNTQGLIPQGIIPGSVYTLNPAPADSAAGSLYKNGAFQIPGVDYVVSGATITMAIPTVYGDRLYYTFPTPASGFAISDVLTYPAVGGEQYRIMAVRHYPGSGYWRALGTRLSTV